MLLLPFILPVSLRINPDFVYSSLSKGEENINDRVFCFFFFCIMSRPVKYTHILFQRKSLQNFIHTHKITLKFQPEWGCSLGGKESRSYQKNLLKPFAVQGHCDFSSILSKEWNILRKQKQKTNKKPCTKRKPGRQLCSGNPLYRLIWQRREEKQSSQQETANSWLGNCRRLLEGAAE